MEDGCGWRRTRIINGGQYQNLALGVGGRAAEDGTHSIGAAEDEDTMTTTCVRPNRKSSLSTPEGTKIDVEYACESRE